MKRWSLAVLFAALPTTVLAQQPVANKPADAEAKIANAVTAAPAFISAEATVMDWPASPDAELPVLRKGTNGWTCLPDFPGSEGNDPMCLDAVWLKFVQAQIAQKQPQIDRVGFGYMLAPGGAYSSASDPFATDPTATNHWGHDGPHLMVVVPDARSLAGLPTTRDSGGPYVMFAGTPYVHVMIPTVEPSKPHKK